MHYFSTRGESPKIEFSEVVATGLAPDGGLYLPERFPDISEALNTWEGLSYTELSFEFLKLFATDIEERRLKEIINKSYEAFSDPKIAPLKQLDDNHFILELFYGPTLAFKDYPLQLLGNLYAEQIERTKTPINVLGATSGDTGSAAIHSLLGKPGVNIFILYPEGRIAPLQELQITCSGASNVFPIAVQGTFDDCQRTVKEVFKDAAFNKQYHLSAVNSINLARLLSQSVYYLYAWLQLPKGKRSYVEFVAPSGNFGNVFSGWMVQQMGLPVEKLRIATNQNDILHRLFSTGRYEVGKVEPSYAPSMDIQVSSNFERFLYFHEKGNFQKVREIVKTFAETGAYHFEHFDPQTFTSSCTRDEEITEIIRRVYERYGYVVDPHTACAFKDVDDTKTTYVSLATAHPAKFPTVIEKAIGIHPTHPILEALKGKEMKHYTLPARTEAVKAFMREYA